MYTYPFRRYDVVMAAESIEMEVEGNENNTNDIDAKYEEEAEDLSYPSNRFELELEFVQALASPAYIHFLATYRDDDDVDARTGRSSDTRPILMRPDFMAYLKYLLTTWSQPEYSRFLSYPHALYFLQLLVERPESALAKEWSLPAFRNFCHQQQFLAWQHRHSTLYGQGSNPTIVASPPDGPQQE